MRHLKSVSAITGVLEKLTHAEGVARHDASEHNIDASRVLQHMHAARQDLLEAEQEIAALIEILGNHTREDAPTEESVPPPES